MSTFIIIKNKILSLIGFLIFTSCGSGESILETSANSTPIPPSVTSVVLSDGKLEITGTALNTITSATMQAQTLSIDQSFMFENQSDTQLTLSVSSDYEISVGTNYNLILLDSQGLSTLIPLTVTLADKSLDFKKLSNKTITGEEIINEKILKYNDGEDGIWEPADDINASPSIESGAITSDKIADGAVISGKIATDAVTTSKIAAGSISSLTMEAGAVTTAKITDAAITQSKLGVMMKRYNFSFNDSGDQLNTNTLYGVGNNLGEFTNPSHSFYIMQRKGTLKNFTVRNLQAPGAGTLTVAILINEVPSTLSVTFDSTENITTKTDSDSVSVVAGDQVTLAFTATNEPGNSKNNTYAGYFELHE